MSADARVARIPLILAIVGLLTFWIPPVGLAVSIIAVTLAAKSRQKRERFSTLALVVGIVGILAFIAMWTSIWILSQ